MPYVFDTNSLRVLQNYYPDTFASFWQELEALAQQGEIWSVREVRRELEKQVRKDWFAEWVKSHPGFFRMPGPQETAFVAQIFEVPHFQELVGRRQQLQGMPVADPWVIAAAHAAGASVVTEEALKPNAARIPNVCQHFGLTCMDVERFIELQGPFGHLLVGM